MHEYQMEGDYEGVDFIISCPGVFLVAVDRNDAANESEPIEMKNNE